VNATIAVASGAARHVLCFRTVYESSAQSQLGGRARIVTGLDPRAENGVSSLKVDGPLEFLMPYGSLYPVNAALMAQRYFFDSGTTREQLGGVAVNARRNAALNPIAVMRKSMSLDDYMNARMISTPLCLFDCDLPVDGSVAFVVSATERIRDASAPVFIESFGSSPGMNASAQMLWENTALTPDDVDIAQLYDGFSIFVPLWLEALGFCPRGGGGKFVAKADHIARDGKLPLSTGGGQLSAGRLHGFGHVYEACFQLRGSAGAHQVEPRPKVAVVSNGAEHFTGCLLLTI
jgi:acetyl-CoA acetyltransferase